MASVLCWERFRLDNRKKKKHSGNIVMYWNRLLRKW